MQSLFDSVREACGPGIWSRGIELDMDGFRMVAAEFTGNQAALRDEADRLRDQLGTGVVVLATRDGDSVRLVATVSKDIAGKKAHAGNLVRELTKMLGGKGGGRPDMAQGGGKNAAALPDALERAYALVAGTE